MVEGDLVRGRDRESEVVPWGENHVGREGQRRQHEESWLEMATRGNWKAVPVGEAGWEEGAEQCMDVHRKGPARVRASEDKLERTLERDSRRSTLLTWCIVQGEGEWPVCN